MNTPENHALLVENARIITSQYYHMNIKRNAAIMDLLGYQPSLPPDEPLGNDDYHFTSYPLDKDRKPALFPPHLERFSDKEIKHGILKLFNMEGLARLKVTLGAIPSGEQGFLSSLQLGLSGLLGAGLSYFYLSNAPGDDLKQPRMNSIYKYCQTTHRSPTDIHNGENMDRYVDWFSDRRFADQALTGVDPTTIERVPVRLYKEFAQAAIDGGYNDWAEKLPQIMQELFVTDCSYFRTAIGAEPREDLEDEKKGNVRIWACASVTLYHLLDNGKLHPVAICLDYKGSMRDSVTIFNQAKEPLAARAPEQKDDWPWRYAKMCAQVSSYIRHEVGTHLTLAHFAEEALIVATNRSFPENHMVSRLLKPHWYKTLSVNVTARSLLVPHIIEQVLGFKRDQLHSLIRHEYSNMDYTQSYVPNDLERRGFPNTIEGLEDRRYRDYAYAKGALRTWAIIRRYVGAALLAEYDKDEADAQVAADKSVRQWCYEAQTNAHIPTFPTIKTFDALVDAVTMSIHIAVPFHSAVNYLQNFYLGFVPSRQPSLTKALPQTLEELRAYQEDHIVESLPVTKSQKYQWLLSVQVPWLLSFKAGEEHNLLSFAKSQYRLHMGSTNKDRVVREAGATLIKDLGKLQGELEEVNDAMHRHSVPYTVLYPNNTAVSILI